MFGELARDGERKVMRLWDHALYDVNLHSIGGGEQAQSYQELIDCHRHLVLRAGDSNDVTSFFRARKGDLAVKLLLQLVDLVHTSKQLTVVEAVNIDGLTDKLGVSLLDHVHDLLFDQVQALGIARRRAANDVVDFDVVLVLAKATAVHGIGELDEDRVLLHDALDVLAADADDALVVLVRDVERDGGGHLLLDHLQPIFSGLVLGAADYNVEVVLVEDIEDDLNATVAHDLVDLAVLLTTNKLFVLVGKLELDAHTVLGLLDKRNSFNHHHGSLYGVIGSIDVEVELLKADLGSGIDADIREHSTNISRGGRALQWIRVGNEP